MKISPKYYKRLDNYLEWVKVTTPASGSFQESRMTSPNITVSENGLSAQEALCIWESTGKSSEVAASNKQLLDLLIKGKAQKDWWFREIGWWDKNASYFPEEFMNYLMPLCFIDLFGRAPVTELVRYYHDNKYSLLAFKVDMCIKSFLYNRPQYSYFERDDRDSWIKTLVRMFNVFYFHPLVFRLKQYLKNSWTETPEEASERQTYSF